MDARFNEATGCRCAAASLDEFLRHGRIYPKREAAPIHTGAALLIVFG